MRTLGVLGDSIPRIISPLRNIYTQEYSYGHINLWFYGRLHLFI